MVAVEVGRVGQGEEARRQPMHGEAPLDLPDQHPQDLQEVRGVRRGDQELKEE